MNRSGKTRIAINGCGRIGRTILRAASAREDVEIVAVNDLLAVEHLAYLLRFDSTHGRFPGEVTVRNGGLVMDGRPVRVTALKDPAELRWGDVGVDVVVESTGLFLDQQRAGAHLQAGAGKVVISAPARDDTPVFVCGVNTDRYSGQAVVSAASCTTNCLAPLAKVLNDAFGIKRGLMTTVHAATATQKTVDGPSAKEWRFGRGILGNIIPASTGAAEAIGRVIPELEGKLTGMALRVPVADVSVVDLTCQLERRVGYDEICSIMRAASESSMKGIIGYTDDAVVSSDLRGEPCICVFDAKAGLELDGELVKLIAWYDNEWGYSCKVLDLTRILVNA